MGLKLYHNGINSGGRGILLVAHALGLNLEEVEVDWRRRSEAENEKVK